MFRSFRPPSPHLCPSAVCCVLPHWDDMDLSLEVAPGIQGYKLLWVLFGIGTFQTQLQIGVQDQKLGKKR